MSKYIISIAYLFLFLPYASCAMWRWNSLKRLIRVPPISRSLQSQSLHPADKLLWEHNLETIKSELKQLYNDYYYTPACKGARQDWLREIHKLEQQKNHARAILNLKPDTYNRTYE
jgi:hypothetical protein